jgi:hypothetical protein
MPARKPTAALFIIGPVKNGRRGPCHVERDIAK